MPSFLKTLAVCILIAACWIGVVAYSRHAYPLDACRACGGTGRDMEPHWMALLRFSIHRRWRHCRVCGGNPVHDIHQR